jgi:hypothetical protein
MLALSPPNSRASASFFSSPYRQTTAHLHFNSFNCRKCLKQIFARNRLQATPKQTPTERNPGEVADSAIGSQSHYFWRMGVLSGRTVNCDPDSMPVSVSTIVNSLCYSS